MSFTYVFLFSLFVGWFSPSEIAYSELENAFATSNASYIAAYGKDKMLISILDKESVYSQSQATLVLRDFFSKKPPTGFKFTMKGKEKTESSFAIGTYQTKTETFRITIYFKKVTSEYKIERLTIERNT